MKRAGAGWYGKRPEIFKQGCARRKAKEWPGFINPEGVPFGPIINLAAFCRDHGLDPSNMRLVALGVVHSHHGWTRLIEKNDYLVLPVPYLGIKGDVYLYKEETGEAFGPIHCEKDVKKCAQGTGIPEWIIREILAKDKDEYQGWVREEG